MKKCAFCGCDNSDDSKFCVNCGTSLPEAAATPVEPVVAATPVAEPVPVQAVPEAPKPQPQPEYRSAIDPQPVTAPAPDYGSYNYGNNTTAAAPASAAPTYNPKPAAQKTNGLCIAGFVISLVSLLCAGFTAIVSLILSICGYVSASKKNQKGKGFAVAGIVISIVLVLFFAFVMFVYYFGEYYSGYSSSSSHKVEEDGDIDYSDMNISRLIKNTDWVEKDDSFLVFDSSSRFHYYRDHGDTSDNYYTGTYEIYVGEDAVEFITEDLSEYGVTEDEIYDIIDANEEYTIDNLICIVLNNESCIVDGEETFDHTVMTPYMGCYLVDDDEVALDIANMNTATYYWFEPEGQ